MALCIEACTGRLQTGYSYISRFSEGALPRRQVQELHLRRSSATRIILYSLSLRVCLSHCETACSTAAVAGAPRKRPVAVAPTPRPPIQALSGGPAARAVQNDVWCICVCLLLPGEAALEELAGPENSTLLDTGMCTNTQSQTMI